MPAQRVVRPIVRSFKQPFTDRAVAWVNLGGHAVLWESPSRARLVVSAPKKGDKYDLGVWAMLDLGKSTWRVQASGPLAGLATTRVPLDCHDIVRGWATRDSIHEGPTRTMKLDCLACGACCRDNDVVLERVDVLRIERGGRPELLKPPFSRRRSDGKLVLKLAPTKDCQQLGADNKCAVYDVRPDACRDFPMGSECCLYARDAEMGIFDGARA